MGTQDAGFADTPDDEFGRGKFRFVKGVYARKGDVVTCENGHPICEFVRDVRAYKAFDSAAMGNWKQPTPQVGDIRAPCKICRERWFKGPYFHFQDGWRLAKR